MAIKKKITNAVGSALSAPQVLRYKRKEMRANADAKLFQMARNAKGAPRFDASGNVTDAFKITSVADGRREELKRRASKGKPLY